MKVSKITASKKQQIWIKEVFDKHPTVVRPRESVSSDLGVWKMELATIEPGSKAAFSN